MKTIAIYLPQFHEVEENNRWWGKGFTDWVTVKNAEPLYAAHRQPRVPLDKNYYDLLEYDTMKWQAALAEKYNVSGFCFYHYWFKGGKKILERPAENLLEWIDINMPFCFSWANQTWARTWTNIQNSNSWVGSDYEKNSEEGGILLRQSYGGKEDWKEHFEYLLPFFQDYRYIRYDNKPIFLIYQPEYMHCLDNMMEYWKELAVKNGLEGICVVTVRSNCRRWSQVDYWLMQEFDYSFISRKKGKTDEPWKIGYEEAWEDILKRAYAGGDENTFYGGFVDVDDTPRRGKQGVSIRDASPEVFEKYFKKLAELSAARKRELIFVNAWNEWGEGSYLEPDEDFKYGYLEAVKRVMNDINRKNDDKIITDMHYVKSALTDGEQGASINADYEKRQLYYKVLSKWMANVLNGKRMWQILSEWHIKNVAVYGMGELGRHLVKELENGIINVRLCIDKRTEFSSIADEIQDIDAVIITPVLEYKDIRLYLKKFFNVPIISLEELISECEML